MPPNDRHREDNKGNIQQDGGRRRQPKDVEAVQNGHGQRRHADEQDVREHQSIQIDRFELDLILSEHREEPNYHREENNTEYRQRRENRAERPEQAVGEGPSLFAGAVPHVIGEYRDEGGGHRAFTYEPPQDIRNPIGEDEGVGKTGRAKEQGQALVPDVSQNAAHDGDDGDDRGRFEDLSFVGRGFGQESEAPSRSLCLTL